MPLIVIGRGYFNPRPPCGGRLCTRNSWPPAAAFQSTSSVWRTTLLPVHCPQQRLQFQSTSSVWRTTKVVRGSKVVGAISIHVLRVEDDCGQRGHPLLRPISIHVLRVEDDTNIGQGLLADVVFQSTSSVWRTTIIRNPGYAFPLQFQSTSSVWRTTPGKARPR